MTLSLVGDDASAAQRADPELSRRTAVAALPCDGGMSWLCLWAGAKASNWDAGDGALLLRSLDGFALR